MCQYINFNCFETGLCDCALQLVSVLDLASSLKIPNFCTLVASLICFGIVYKSAKM